MQVESENCCHIQSMHEWYISTGGHSTFSEKSMFDVSVSRKMQTKTLKGEICSGSCNDPDHYKIPLHEYRIKIKKKS